MLGKEGDYIVYAKDNQPDLKAHVEDAFTVAASGDFSPATPSRVRPGHAPRVLASFRNVAVHLLHNTAHKNLPAATEAITHDPQLALQLLRSKNTISE